MAKLQHIITDLHQVYLTEMEAQIKPQLGKSSASSSGSGGDKKDASGGGGGDNVKKQARQLVYDTRYKARREGLPLERAFAQALQNSKASAPVKDAAKSMLFSGGVKEEIDIEEEDGKQKVLVTPAKGYGKPYRRYASRTKIHQLRSNPQIQSVTGTSYGTPYEGERTKGKQTSDALQHKSPNKKDRDGDGKVESGSKEHAGVVHNAIQKATGGVPDGKDTRKKGVKKESFERLSDWRQDLCEVISNSKNQYVKKISEKNINNKIVINPNLKEETILEAVYGGGKKEPEDKRMVVTKADKTGNTKAWQNFKAGNPSYKAASHLQKSSFEPEGDSVDEGLAQAHKIAKKIEAQEAVDPQSSLSPKQKDTEQQQTLNAKAKLERILATRKGTYQEETELDELNRLEKETGKDIKGKPVVKGGTMGGDDTHSKVMRHMHKVMGAGRMGAGGAIQPRGVKKQKGEPTPGPSITPAQKVAKRRAAAQRAQDNMSSRYD